MHFFIDLVIRLYSRKSLKKIASQKPAPPTTPEKVHLSRPEPLGQASKPHRSRSNNSTDFKINSTPEKPIPSGLPSSPASSEDDSIDSKICRCLLVSKCLPGSACMVLDFDRQARSSTPDRFRLTRTPDLNQPNDSEDEMQESSLSSKIFSALRLIGLSSKTSDIGTDNGESEV